MRVSACSGGADLSFSLPLGSGLKLDAVGGLKECSGHNAEANM